MLKYLIYIIIDINFIHQGGNDMEERTIQMDLCSTRKEKPISDQLQFGKIFTDHMFIMDFTDALGWHDARIVPYQPITIDPSAMIFHYGQSVFEEVGS